MSVVALVRRPGYRDLLVGQGVSSLGDWMGTVALMALVLELTNSPIAVGRHPHAAAAAGGDRRAARGAGRGCAGIAGARCSRWTRRAR